MAKRDHDSTMDLSLSQLVVPKPPKAPPRGMNPNDVSVWGQMVVGQAEFAPAPKKRAAHAPLWIGLGVVGTLAIAAAVYVMFMRPAPGPEVVAAATPAPGSAVTEAAKPAAATPTPAPDPAKPAAALTQPAAPAETPAAAKPSEPADPQQVLAPAEPVLGSIRGLVGLMRSAFVGVSSLDPKKLNAAKKAAPVKKKPAPKAVRRRR